MPGIAETVSIGVAPEQARALCVFLHGRNQSPEEMESAVIRRLSATDIAYVLPRAGDRCWYHALAVDPRTEATERELARSLSDLGEVIRNLRQVAAGRPLVLAGFSQGACLALEHAFAGNTAPDAVAAFTGCRVGDATSTRSNGLPAGLPVYLSAGSADPWIPITAFAEAVVELGRSGAKLRCDVFPGRPHKVCDAEIAMLDVMLADVVDGGRSGMEAPR